MEIPSEITNEELESVSPFLYIKNNGIKNEAGLPLEFDDREFMIDILEDMSPLQVILKAPQVGATVLETIKALWVAKFERRDIIYTLPTAGDITDMVGGKINRIIAQNPSLLEMVKDHDTIEQKQVGDNIIYFRGTWTSKQAMMVSSQLNLHDEVDASNREVITQYETRQQASTNGWRWYFSHPSIVGAGIDAYWQKSDQKEWFVHCTFCDKWQFLEWPISINQEKQIYVCKFCEAQISDQQRRKGQWRKRYPIAEYSGYHISQLICPWIPASKVIKDFREKEPQYFHNFVLALPYADAQSKITLETIKGLLTDNFKRKGRVLIGLDTGVKLRYMVGDQNGLFDIGEVDNYEDLQKVCDKYGDWVMVADAGGDIIGMRQFQENNRGKVFLCSFRQDKQSQNLIKWGESDEFGRVACDRNRMIQLVVDLMNDKRIPLYGTLEKWWSFWLHCSHIFRTVEEDRLGNLVYIWQRSGRDDWFLATVYYCVARDRFSEKESTFEGKSEDVPQVDEAPIRDYRGYTGGIILTPPKVNTRDDDWRYSG